MFFGGFSVQRQLDKKNPTQEEHPRNQIGEFCYNLYKMKFSLSFRFV